MREDSVDKSRGHTHTHEQQIMGRIAEILQDFIAPECMCPDGRYVDAFGLSAMDFPTLYDE